jgi:hypothetical protein
MRQVLLEKQLLQDELAKMRSNMNSFMSAQAESLYAGNPQHQMQQ